MDQSSDILYHFYDLETAPPTFNFIYSLISSEIARKELFHHERTHLVLVPGSNGGFNAINPYDAQAKLWRLWSIIVPAMALCPSLDSYTLLPSRESADLLIKKAGPNVFPLGYSLDNPSDCCQHISHNLNVALGYKLPSLRAPELGHDYVERYLNRICPNKPFVTITLRQCKYNVNRNADLEIWKKVSQFLQNNGFFVIVLPDYTSVVDSPDQIFPGTHTARECVINLHLRTALYEKAELNLGTTGGTFACAVFNNRCNYIWSHFLIPGVWNSSERWVKEMGLSVGKDVNYYDKFGYWIWQEDNSDVIIAACEDYLRYRKEGGAFLTDRQITCQDIFDSLSTLLGKETIEAISNKYGNRKRGPVFVNRKFSEKKLPYYEVVYPD